MKNLNLISEDDIKELYHTGFHCFYHEQPHRFEILKGKIEDIPDKTGSLRWYEDYLNALIAYNYYSNHTKFKAVLLYDLAERELDGKIVTSNSERYCIAINIQIGSR